MCWCLSVGPRSRQVKISAANLAVRRSVPYQAVSASERERHKFNSFRTKCDRLNSIAPGDVCVRSTAPVCLCSCPCCEREGRAKEVYEAVELRSKPRARSCGAGQEALHIFIKNAHLQINFGSSSPVEMLGIKVARWLRQRSYLSCGLWDFNKTEHPGDTDFNCDRTRLIKSTCCKTGRQKKKPATKPEDIIWHSKHIYLLRNNEAIEFQVALELFALKKRRKKQTKIWVPCFRWAFDLMPVNSGNTKHICLSGVFEKYS